MSNKIDKKLENRRKTADSDHEHLNKWCNNFWKVAWVIVIIFISFGIYHDWHFKNMVSIAFSHGITAILTYLIQNFYYQQKNFFT
jgi:hypothetical protein